MLGVTRVIRPVGLVGAALAALVTWAVVTPSASHAVTHPAPPNKGMNFAGLSKVTIGPCAHEYVVLHATAHGQPICTHGPDPSDEFYYAEAKGSGSTGGKGKPAPSPSPTPTTSPSPSPSPTTTSSGSGGRCGTDGSRVQAIYAHAADIPDNYASVASSLHQYLNTVDNIFNNSAAETGGVRHVRFVTDAYCNPVIVDVTLSTTGDDSFSNTINELEAMGYNSTSRKYLVWVDANVYCGIGTVSSDDSAGATNANNSGPSFGRTDAGCWGGQTEAHELMHNLGGVQLSAPHSDGAWHCTDEYDRMCYQENNNVMTYPCDLSHDALFDCGHDDYYNTNPDPSNYLYTHWNTANSAFLTSSAT